MLSNFTGDIYTVKIMTRELKAFRRLCVLYLHTKHLLTIHLLNLLCDETTVVKILLNQMKKVLKES